MEKYAIIETVFDEEYKIVIRSRFSEEVYMFLADTYYVGDPHKNTARINRFISYEAAKKALVELSMPEETKECDCGGYDCRSCSGDT